MVSQPTLFRPIILLFLAFCLSASGQDGMYADFVTSKGNFTCRLEFEKTPRTVASFVGLASGQKPWLDLKTGAIRQTPFYNGITFHRVISGFVIQGGSPAGDGTDGPGYRFRDELRTDLRHNKAGILSMAHSGKNTHTNGSQFFVTLAPTQHLDDIHTVFGEVTSGLDVVMAIGAVPVGVNDRPITPVVMESVTIRRVGPAAQAFDVAAHNLPLVKSVDPRIFREAGKTYLSYPWALHTEYQFFQSTNLATWGKQRLGFSGKTLPTGNLDVSSVIGNATQQFYRVPQIVYPAPFVEPTSLLGGTMQFTFTDGRVLTMQFTGSATGSFTLTNPATSGAIQSYVWNPEFEVYTARINCTLQGLSPTDMIFAPIFATPTSGTFQTNVYTGSGTFTYTPAAAPVMAQAAESSSATVQEATSSSTIRKRTTRRARQVR